MKRFVTIAAFVCLACTAFSQTSETAKEPAKCKIQGLVVEDPGNKPLRKVQVQLAGVSESLRTCSKASIQICIGTCPKTSTERNTEGIQERFAVLPFVVPLRFGEGFICAFATASRSAMME